MKKTVLKTMTTLLLLVALCVSIAIVLVAYEGKKDVIAVDNKGNEYDSTTIYNMPSNIQFLNTVSDEKEIVEKTVTLRATIEPSNAINKDLKWSLSWKNASSEWARDKVVTDYLTTTPNADTVTLTCKSPFGEQAVVTVQSVDNPNAKATCVVDCIAYASIGISVYFKESAEAQMEEFYNIEDIRNFACSGDTHVTCLRLKNWECHRDLYTRYIFKPTKFYGLGTIRPSIDYAPSISLWSTPDFIKALRETSNNSAAIATGISRKHSIPLTNNEFYELTCDAYLNTFAPSHFTMQQLPGSRLYDYFVQTNFNTPLNLYFSANIDGKEIESIPICTVIDESTCKYFGVKSIKLNNTTVAI